MEPRFPAFTPAVPHGVEEIAPQLEGARVGRVESPQQMRDIIHEEMGKLIRLDGLTYEALAKEPQKPVHAVLDPKTGAVKTPCSWRFRVREIGPVRVAAVVGGTDITVWRTMLGIGFGEMHKAIKLQQENGEWALIGYAVRDMRRRIRSREPNPSAQAVTPARYAGQDGPQQAMKGQHDQPMKTVLGYRDDLSYVIDLVFIDHSHSEELDKWEMETGKKNAPMQNWTAGNHFPSQFQAERDRALEIIRKLVPAKE